MRRGPSARRAYRDPGARILSGRTTVWSPSSSPVRHRSLGRCNSTGRTRCSRRGCTSQRQSDPITIRHRSSDRSRPNLPDPVYWVTPRHLVGDDGVLAERIDDTVSDLGRRMWPAPVSPRLPDAGEKVDLHLPRFPPRPPCGKAHRRGVRGPSTGGAQKEPAAARGLRTAGVPGAPPCRRRGRSRHTGPAGTLGGAEDVGGRRGGNAHLGEVERLQRGDREPGGDSVRQTTRRRTRRRAAAIARRSRRRPPPGPAPRRRSARPGDGPALAAPGVRLKHGRSPSCSTTLPARRAARRRCEAKPLHHRPDANVTAAPVEPAPGTRRGARHPDGARCRRSRTGCPARLRAGCRRHSSSPGVTATGRTGTCGGASFSP